AEVPLPAGEARGYLARFLFRGDDVFKEVSALSGGERSRLELALLGVLPSNVLLLDEPTNHLDIPAREALESFLRETAATVLLVSHDRRLLETICDRLWVVDDALAVPFEGGYRAWRSAIAEGWRAGDAAARERARLHGGGVTIGATMRTGTAPARTAPETARRGRVPTATAEPAGSRAVAAARATDAATARAAPKLSKDAYRRRKLVVEADLERLGRRKGELETAIVDPEVQSNFVEMRRIANELADVDEALGAAEEAWLIVEEQAP
ncbi:MAG: ATP-binding cassette domain-containing protein, partial [Chloroflexota bacterium]